MDSLPTVDPNAQSIQIVITVEFAVISSALTLVQEFVEVMQNVEWLLIKLVVHVPKIPWEILSINAIRKYQEKTKLKVHVIHPHAVLMLNA